MTKSESKYQRVQDKSETIENVSSPDSSPRPDSSTTALHYSPPRPLRSQNSGHLIIPRISKSTAGGADPFPI